MGSGEHWSQWKCVLGSGCQWVWREGTGLLPTGEHSKGPLRSWALALEGHLAKGYWR